MGDTSVGFDVFCVAGRKGSRSGIASVMWPAWITPRDAVADNFALFSCHVREMQVKLENKDF